MAKDYALITYMPIPISNTMCIALNKERSDHSLYPSVYYALECSEEQPHVPYRSMKINKTQAESLAKDLLSLFDEEKVDGPMCGHKN